VGSGAAEDEAGTGVDVVACVVGSAVVTDPGSVEPADVTLAAEPDEQPNSATTAVVIAAARRTPRVRIALRSRRAAQKRGQFLPYEGKKMVSKKAVHST